MAKNPKVNDMADKIRTLEQRLGKRGAAKARRILFSQYQKYLMNCLKSGAEAKQFVEWLQALKAPK